MKIVIDIPEEDYEMIKNTTFTENTETIFRQSSEDRKGTIMLFRLLDSVTDGTPLPKGHGRLIDADALEKKICEAIQESSAVSVTLDTFAPTIVESDKEVE